MHWLPSCGAALILATLGVAQGPLVLRSPGDVHAERIEVKLSERSGAVLDGDGRLVSRTGVDVSGVARLFDEAASTERLVTVPLELLDRWHREADERLPEGLVRPGHLGLWFLLRCADARSASELLARLQGEEFVEDAYLEPIPRWSALPGAAARPDDIPPTTPDLTSYQTYRAAPPVGFGFDAARSILGARGGDVHVYHCETDWVWTHEDLDFTAANFIGGPSPGNTSGSDHGTGVVGLLAAQRNGYGLTGVVDRAGIRMVSTLFGSVADVIATSAQHGSPGDVITLIGTYNLYWVKPRDEVPLEYVRSNFDAILTATTQGLVLVEAAGNGDNDLDDPRFARVFDLSMRDSGAIMVGATEGSTPARADFSNYGSRIDTNAWGRGVTTLGYGSLFHVPGDRRQEYTERYAGTSSASTIVTGVMASLSGAMKRQLGRALTPLEARQLLRSHGSPVTGNIGSRADLVGMLDALGLPDGIELAAPEVALGSAVSATLSGPAGATCGLALSFGVTSLEIGLGRPLHLDPASTISIGAFPLVNGSAQWSDSVPNDPALAGLDLFVQGVVFDPASGSVRLTSSAGFWIH